MYTAHTLNNPAGIPPEAPQLTGSDYIHAASLTTLKDIIQDARRNAEATITATIKRTTITFTIQPYLDDQDHPSLWMEAYTSNPLQDTSAKLIGMARLRSQEDGDQRQESASLIRQFLQAKAFLHEE